MKYMIITIDISIFAIFCLFPTDLISCCTDLQQDPDLNVKTINDTVEFKGIGGVSRKNWRRVVQ